MCECADIGAASRWSYCPDLTSPNSTHCMRRLHWQPTHSHDHISQRRSPCLACRCTTVSFAVAVDDDEKAVTDGEKISATSGQRLCSRFWHWPWLRKMLPIVPGVRTQDVANWLGITDSPIYSIAGDSGSVGTVALRQLEMKGRRPTGGWREHVADSSGRGLILEKVARHAALPTHSSVFIDRKSCCAHVTRRQPEAVVAGRPLCATRLRHHEESHASWRDEGREWRHGGG